MRHFDCGSIPNSAFGDAADIGAYETQPESYAYWSNYTFPPGTSPALPAADADPDGDGIRNGLEQVFATNPLAPTSPSSLLQLNVQGNYLVLRFERSLTMAPAKVLAEQSLELQVWNTTGLTYANLGPTLGRTELIQALITINDATKKFGRLRYNP